MELADEGGRAEVVGEGRADEEHEGNSERERTIEKAMKKPLTDQQTEFLVAYRTEGRVKPAAARAGCSRELHYNALRTSETYRKAFAMVQRDFVDELEEEMRQRAIYGVKIPKFYRGEVIGYETRYSDTLLMVLLEANNPEKFGGIREELREQDGDAGFCVRWDREEVGRPTLPRMTGPMPPAPPRPPRPPVPPISECGEPVTYAEWAAARGITGRGACGPVNEETLDRWSASENPGSIEWVPEEAAMDLASDDADADPWQEAVAGIDDSEGDDSGVDFCVRWGAAEPDWLDDGSALQASEEMGAGVTRSGGTGWRARSPFQPEKPASGADDLGGDDSDVGFGVRWMGRGHGESSATVAWFPVGKRLGRRAKRVPAPRPKIPRPFADCRPRLNRAASRAPPRRRNHPPTKRAWASQPP